MLECGRVHSPSYQFEIHRISSCIIYIDSKDVIIPQLLSLLLFSKSYRDLLGAITNDLQKTGRCNVAFSKTPYGMIMYSWMLSKHDPNFEMYQRGCDYYLIRILLYIISMQYSNSIESSECTKQDW